jgi:integrase
LKLLVSALSNTVGTKALFVPMKLILLTLVRRGELTNARWADVDLQKMEWRLPTSKTGEPHLVPLSVQAAKLFGELAALAGDSSWVLPGRSGSSVKSCSPIECCGTRPGRKASRAAGGRFF